MLGVTWPALSTIGDILKRAGLVESRRRPRRPVAIADVIPGVVAPSGEWAIDVKGWYRTRDGRRCDPLTITDTLSRYLIAIDIIEPTTAGVRAVLERVFAEYGLPAAIRSDNGQPLGSHGCGGLSVLAVWWLKLGIEPHYIPPASPPAETMFRRAQRPALFSQELAHAPHAERADVEAAGRRPQRTAAALRRVSRALQQRAAARSPRSAAAVHPVEGVGSPAAAAAPGAVVRRQSPGLPGA